MRHLLQALKGKFRRPSFADLEAVGPCSNCSTGLIVVVGWTGWEEILECTDCSWKG